MWSDLWKKWPEMQMDMFKDWMDLWVRMAGAPGESDKGSPGRSMRDAQGFYMRWQEYLQEMMEKFELPEKGVGPETFMRMFHTADVYTHLYSLWMKMFESYRKAAGEAEGYDFEAMSKAIEAWSEEYREIVHKVFIPALPEQLRWIADLYSGEIPLMFSGLMMHLWAPWYDYARRMTERGISLEGPSPEAGVEVYEGWRKAYEESFGRLLRAPVMGYYRETVEKLTHAVDSLTEFNILLAEFYAELESVGAKSFEKLQERLASMRAEGEDGPMSFRDLYRLWWQTNEDLYIELFRTEKYSKLQGQLVDKGMQFRSDFQAYFEEATKELPFPKRSEMDHLYRTVDRLKREVRSLKKELGEMRSKAAGPRGEG